MDTNHGVDPKKGGIIIHILFAGLAMTGFKCLCRLANLIISDSWN